MAHILLVNGILTHGENNVDLLRPYLEASGHEVTDVRLPRRGPFTARFTAARDAKIIVNYSRGNDVIVAHSFGCLRAAHATRFRDYAAIICIAPAMSKHHTWPRPGRVVCYHSRTDRALKAGALLLLHPFGRAGLDGFGQARVENINCFGMGHGDYFYPPYIEHMADHIARVARYMAP